MKLVLARTKYLVNRGVGGQGAVEDGELPLQPLRDVVAASPRMNHGCQKLHVHNVGELAGFLQVVETILLHQLPDNLIGHLCRNYSFWFTSLCCSLVCVTEICEVYGCTVSSPHPFPKKENKIRSFTVQQRENGLIKFEEISNLISPFVDDRHVDIINENGHFLASRRTVRAPHPLIQIAFDSALQGTRREMW